MNSIKFKLDGLGVRELLKGAEMQSIIEKSTSQVLQAAEETGLEYSSDVIPRKKRVVGRVIAESVHAGNDAKANNTLQKALRRCKV